MRNLQKGPRARSQIPAAEVARRLLLWRAVQE